jgi:hypothetical protein
VHVHVHDRSTAIRRLVDPQAIIGPRLELVAETQRPIMRRQFDSLEITARQSDSSRSGRRTVFEDDPWLARFLAPSRSPPPTAFSSVTAAAAS